MGDVGLGAGLQFERLERRMADRGTVGLDGGLDLGKAPLGISVTSTLTL